MPTQSLPKQKSTPIAFLVFAVLSLSSVLIWGLLMLLGMATYMYEKPVDWNDPQYLSMAIFWYYPLYVLCLLALGFLVYRYAKNNVLAGIMAGIPIFLLGISFILILT
jgi:ABC-type transport system involved in multi-copper enzyme maturation permease subunit